MSEPLTTVVVVDDHPALTTVLTTYLGEHECDVVATAADGRQAVDTVTSHAPDVVVVDYRMPYLEGAPLLRALREARPESRLIVYTAEADADVWAEASAAGAAGLVLKESPLADLRRAIAAALDGRPYLDPGIASLVFSGPRTPALWLTPREVDVLSLVADGLSHEAIAGRLGIGSETVRTHVRKSCARLGAATRTEAVATAFRLGLIS